MRRRIGIVRLGSLLSSLMLASLLPPLASAGTLGPGVVEAYGSGRASDTAPLIVRFARRVEPAMATRAERSRGAQRSSLVRVLRQHAERTQAGALALVDAHAGRAVRTLWIRNALALDASLELARALAALPEVESVDLDATLALPQSWPAAGVPVESGPQLVRAPELWAGGETGAGAVVATLDSGVDPAHPDLGARWRGGPGGWFDPHSEHASPHDADGHGTQVLGLLVGGAAGGSAIGVAPDAQWIAAKIYDDTGLASLSAIHLSLQWLLDPDGDPATDDVPDVVNNSWGFVDGLNACEPEFDPDFAALRAARVAVVFAAGNQGPQELTSLPPASSAGVLAVGAVDGALQIAPFSSRGPSACGGDTFPELVAPGVALRTTDLTFGGLFPDAYVQATGTSFAAPLVAGTLALLIAALPGAGVDQLEQALASSARDLGPAGPDTAYGGGLVDAAAARTTLAELLAAPACSDDDRDGYFAQAGCGTALDCQDRDASIHPGACDVKADGLDQDCDGADRTSGRACPGTGGGDSGTSVENTRKLCGDGKDNDRDGLMDCADPDCAGRGCR